jgi:hypothetical protein
MLKDLIDAYNTPDPVVETQEEAPVAPVVAPPVDIAKPQPLVQAPRVQNMTQETVDGMAPVNPAVQRLKDLGYNDSDIQSYLQPDKSSPSAFEDIYKKNLQAPTPISERGMRAARTASSISDSLGTLAEVFGASRGAHVQPNNNPSATAQQSNDERNVRNLYDQRLQQYNQGLAGAQVQDMEAQANERTNLRRQMVGSLQNKAKQDAIDRKEAAAEAYRLNKEAQDFELKLKEFGLKGKELDNKVKEFKGKQAVDWYQAQTGRLNSQKYTGSLAGATPEDLVKVNEQAEALPKDWVSKKGYMTVTPGKGVAAKPTYHWNSKATPAIKKQLIEDYNKEHGVTTAKTGDSLGIL